MNRIPEPELMEGEAQARAYAEADFEEPHQHCLNLLQEVLQLPKTGTALDLGCGPADITLRFARGFPRWRVDGVDGSAAMLRYGHEAVAQANLQERVQLVQAYLPSNLSSWDDQLSSEASTALDRHYQCIFSNSLLHHLAEPTILWQSVHRWAAPGAGIFVMDLMRPSDKETARQMVEIYAANEPTVLQEDFLNSLLAAYTLEEVQAQLAQANLAAFQVKAVSDRHLIVWGHYP